MMIRSIKILLTFATTLVSFSACGDSHSKETSAKMEKYV